MKMCFLSHPNVICRLGPAFPDKSVFKPYNRIECIQCLNDLDLVWVVVKIVVKNSSHRPGSYSKSGCMSHSRSAQTSLKRLSNPLNAFWSLHSFLTATSFFRCWSTHLKVGYPCFHRMVWWNQSVTRNIEMSAECAPSPHQTLHFDNRP